MIKSMTGFGRGESAANGFQISVEIKTLNSRYLDISIRSPQSLQQQEFDIKEIVQKHISRGKAHISIYVDKSNLGKPDITFDENLVKAYGKMLEQIKFLANIQEPVQLKDILHFDELFKPSEVDESEIEVIWENAQLALEKALNLMNSMRIQEGKELKNDLTKQITGISDMITEVRDLSDKRAPEVREKLQGRIHSMIDEEKVDKDRLETEIALLVDKMDVNEEIIRLDSHLKFFLEALETDEPVGRRLNFLCQEINRELNTIGAKCNDSEISHHIVLGKEKLEQIREQVQNIE
jgi:uncharacterized protein (TIGR00255 family)